jgi:hypothetical protein
MTLPSCSRTVLALLLLVPSAFSEEGNGAEETFIPNFSVGGAGFTQTAKAETEDGAGSLQRREAEASGNIPFFMGDNFRLFGGVEYRWTSFDFTGMPAPLDSTTLDVQAVQVPFNLWADLSDRWKLWVRLQPGIQSDMEAISDDDFILMSLALASYQWNDWLTLAFGGFYSRDLGQERLLPAVGLILRSDPHWSLALTFPRLEFAYAPNEEWLFTARTVLSGGGWNITDPAGGEDINLYYQAIRAGLGVEHRITGPLWLYGDAGVEFAQELEVEGGGYDTTTSLDPAGFFSVGAKLRF